MKVCFLYKSKAGNDGWWRGMMNEERLWTKLKVYSSVLRSKLMMNWPCHIEQYTLSFKHNPCLKADSATAGTGLESQLSWTACKRFFFFFWLLMLFLFNLKSTGLIEHFYMNDILIYHYTRVSSNYINAFKSIAQAKYKLEWPALWGQANSPCKLFKNILNNVLGKSKNIKKSLC